MIWGCVGRVGFAPPSSGGVGASPDLHGAGDRPVLSCGVRAETPAHDRRREEEGADWPKPQFADVARVTVEEWGDEGPEAAQALKARMREVRQQRFAAGEMTDSVEVVPSVH